VQLVSTNKDNTIFAFREVSDNDAIVLEKLGLEKEMHLIYNQPEDTEVWEKRNERSQDPDVIAEDNWIDTDILSALDLKDIEPTEELISEVIRRCKHRERLQDAIISAGWDCIYDIIDEIVWEKEGGACH